MSLNRLLFLTYNGVTIGQGSAIGEPAGGWSLFMSPETGVVSMRFVVADQAGGTAYAHMAAVEAAFSVRRQHLTIGVASTPINDFDPDFTVLTGYEAYPEIRHGEAISGPHSYGAETYEVTIRFRRPADNNGRRDEHPSIQKSQAIRRKVRFDGVWTAVAGSAGAREQFEDPSTGFEPHATTFLDDYDNTVAWTEAVHDVNVNDTDTEVSYHSEFWENVHGQVNEERTVHVDLHGLRRALVVGTWINPAGVSSGAGALAAFNNVTTGFLAQIRAWLSANFASAVFNPYSIDPRVNVTDGTVDYAAELWECQYPSAVNTGRRFSRIGVDPLPSGRLRGTVSGVYMASLVAGVQISALLNFRDGTNGGAAYTADVQTALAIAYGGGITWDAPTVLRYNYNEQQGIVEFEFSFKQITVNQSLSAAKDVDIIDDQWDLTSTTVGPGDSPFVIGGGSITSAANGGIVKRPLRLEATYRAWIKLGVDPMTKWNSGLQALVIQNIQTYLKPTTVAGALLKVVPEVNPTDNTITATVSMEAYVSAYLELSIEENVSRDEGDIYSPNLSGNDDDYDMEQGPTQGTKVRTTRLLSTQANAVNAFLSPKINGVWRRLRHSISSHTIVVGAAPAQTAIYFGELHEEFLRVQSVTEDSAGPSSNAQPTFSGTGNNPNSGNQGAGASSPDQGNSGGGVAPRAPDNINSGVISDGPVSNTDYGADGGGVPPLNFGPIGPSSDGGDAGFVPVVGDLGGNTGSNGF